MALLIQDTEEFEQKIFNKLEHIRNSLLKDLIRELNEKQPEEYLSREDVAKLFKIHTNTVDDWTRKGKLRKYGISGSKVIYKRSEIESSLTLLE